MTNGDLVLYMNSFTLDENLSLQKSCQPRIPVSKAVILNMWVVTPGGGGWGGLVHRGQLSDIYITIHDCSNITVIK